MAKSNSARRVFLKKLSRSRPLFLYFHLFRYSFFNTNGSKKCLWLDSKRGSLVVGSNCSINYATTTDQSRLKSIYAISLLLPCLIHHWVNGSGKESLTYYYVVGTTSPKRLNLFQCGIKILFFSSWDVRKLRPGYQSCSVNKLPVCVKPCLTHDTPSRPCQIVVRHEVLAARPKA